MNGETLGAFITRAAVKLTQFETDPNSINSDLARALSDIAGWWTDADAQSEESPWDEHYAGQLWSLALVLDSIQPLAEAILGEKFD